MNQLIKAIGDRYKTVNTFRANLTGGLHIAQASQNSVYPFAVLNVISVVHDPILDDYFESALVQFSIFSSEKSPSEVGSLYEYLRALFDDCELSISEYIHIFMEREIGRLVYITDESTGEKYWEYSVDYRIYFEKS